MKKSKLYLTISLCLLMSLQGFSQDYDFVARKLFNEDYNETHTPFLKTTIEDLGKQQLIYSLKESLNNLERLVKERDNKLENIKDNFENQYDEPEYYSDCKNFKTYSQKNESSIKRINTLSGFVSLAETNYNLCKNNVYRTTNCSSQYNNYNRQVNLYNVAVSEQKKYYKKAISYQSRCTDYFNKYERARKNVESNYNTKENSYNTRIRNVGNTVNRYNDELVSILNNALYPAKEYYSNGNLKNSGNKFFGTGKATGEWNIYFESGELSNIGSYLNGKQTGEWKRFYKSGQLEFLDNYKNGKHNGSSKNYHENGGLKSIGEYQNDKRTNEWKYYYENGKLKEKGSFINDKQTGLWKYYHENGKLKTTAEWANDKLTGNQIKYDENGNEKIDATDYKQNLRLAQEGDATAQYNLGLMLFKGQKTNKDLEKSFYWTKKSAEQGYTNAQFTLGRKYMLEEGIERDGDKAFYWAKIAAEKGDKDGQFLLGYLYFHGTYDKMFGNTNWSKAKIWLTKAKEQGHTGSQNLLDQIGDD